MTYVITSNCTQDGECVDACPVDCIHPNRNEPGFGEGVMLYVNPDECIDCGACEPVCPAEAIFSEDNSPDEWQSFKGINRLYYQDPAAAEAAAHAYRDSH